MYQKSHRTPSKNSPTRPKSSQSAPDEASSAQRMEQAPPQFSHNIRNIPISAPERSASAPATAPVEPQTFNWTRLLARDRLNVIGEDHGESNMRRGEEQQFCEKQTDGGKYWQEWQFKERNYDPRDTPKDTRDPADPWDLRLLQCIAFIRHSIGTVRKGKYTNKLQLLNIIDNRIIYFLNQINFNYEELKRESQGFNWKNKNGEQGVKDLQPEINYFVKISSSIDKDKYGLQKLSLEEATTKFTMLTIAIENKINKTEQIMLRNNPHPNVGPDFTFDDVAELRSKAMHEAAQNRCNVKGVWKIGLKHLEHLESYGHKKYNIVTREQFNQVFTKWYNDLYSIV